MVDEALTPSWDPRTADSECPAWEYFGNQMPQIPNTGDYGTDRICRLTCLNVIRVHWLDRLEPIRRPSLPV
jgi:hypothetical protein